MLHFIFGNFDNIQVVSLGLGQQDSSVKQNYCCRDRCVENHLHGLLRPVYCWQVAVFDWVLLKQLMCFGPVQSQLTFGKVLNDLIDFYCCLMHVTVAYFLCHFDLQISDNLLETYEA